jgi:hypothetical protein
VGFIAGDPKARKSWVALDLALSIAGSASGYNTKFLDCFTVARPEPVLYFMLEDKQSLYSRRARKVWDAKTEFDKSRIFLQDGVIMSEHSATPGPLMTTVIEQMLTLSDDDDRRAFRERIRAGYEMPDGEPRPYSLVVVDTLFRSAGPVDINNSGEVMAKILDPLTKIAHKEGVTILIVHHYSKGKVEGPTRGGTRILGSQALHSWSENSLYLTAGDHSFGLELESKAAPTNQWMFDTDPTQRTWAPKRRDDTSAPVRSLDFTHVHEPAPRTPTVLAALRSLGPGEHTTRAISDLTGWSPASTHNSLKRHCDQGKVVKIGTRWRVLA